MTGPIVVGIDGREPADALAFPAELAERLGSELVLVHVAGVPLPFPYGDVRLTELMRREAVAQGTAMLDQAAAPVSSLVGETRVEFGEPAEALRRVARELQASLVVLFPRERHAVARALWRGTSGTVAAQSPCPVLVIPRELDRRAAAFGSGGPIVVGSDGSTESDRAVVVADALSDRLDLAVLPVAIDIADEAARGAIRYRNIHRRPGEALAEIARRARGALLVVGTAGGSWLSGSVAQRLIGSAPVPLVVVPEPRSHGGR
jgi:nucleotide-binding universal stress UspA family protein